MDIASNIKAVRKAKGITPTMMAKELGIEATNYPKFENRSNQLTYNNLEKISNALGITVIELLTWGEEKPQTLNQPNLDNLKLDIENFKELIRYQREKIDYLQSSSADLIIEMAFSEFDNEAADRAKLIENPETGETDFEYPEEEWLKFLALYLIQNDWAWELVERGITDEKLIMRVYNDTGMPVSIPEDIKRKQRKRQAIRKKSVGGAF
ncbi:helix-turn-helix transcriptional regulator [uncultured Spirosoma sp.]|uniref:helix-turn-helix domain-containing protein n=1 Tax=uncultured Spirosoma sp. TaxID=278208 RepID=UPI00258B7202|nr:helix-turn-helix transcriptional regulator [uncultured Spirosoma sp.]